MITLIIMIHGNKPTTNTTNINIINVLIIMIINNSTITALSI